jgi:2-polyprenyl-3-methyl-5-hydroxy-6-metoxy-1,4-benzoquinol methylase
MMNKRDYNDEIRDNEGRKYAYTFDMQVMHPMMLRTFAPFFQGENVLEMGSYKGEFTQRLTEYFQDVTCIEASGEALAMAQERIGVRATYIQGLFENVKLDRRFDNIVLTHVLEHLDDPVTVLKRINDEWLTDKGRLFLACPNAHAGSRQIAVRMGLIDHATDVTASERQHGHRITYSFDLLERDATKAGLKILFRTGVFFKALANFQWDQLLGTKVLSDEYMEGCYRLGQIYPDLCSSIVLICARG